jgi:hypothetical protein
VAPFPGLAGRGEQGIFQDRMQDLRQKTRRYRRYCAIRDLGTKIYGPFFSTSNGYGATSRQVLEF